MPALRPSTMFSPIARKTLDGEPGLIADHAADTAAATTLRAALTTVRGQLLVMSTPGSHPGPPLPGQCSPAAAPDGGPSWEPAEQSLLVVYRKYVRLANAST
jgi:hypothetical protein